MALYRPEVVRMKRQFRRTTILSATCAFILLGIGLSRLHSFPGPEWLLVFGLLTLLLARRRTLALLLIVICFGLLIGWWRGSAQYKDLQTLRAYAEQKVTVEVTANEDAVYGAKGQLTFAGGNVMLLSPDERPLIGTFKIGGFGEPMVYRGDRVVVEGKIFPTRGSKQATMLFAELTKLDGAASQSWLEKSRHKFVAGMYNALPEPLGSFALGLLVGQRSTMPEATALALSIVGLTHIVAVSGYNLTILVRAVSRVKFLGSKFQKLILSYLLIGLFIMVTGFSASIVRAGLVALLGLWAWYYGRSLKPVLLILLVAAMTGLVNPLYVWSDIGWYLSFLAFFGVLVLAPLMAGRLFKKREPKTITMMLIETIAAQIMTMPLIMMIFGQVSGVSVLANLLVVPLVPLAMLFGAIAAAIGAVAPAIVGFAAWPAKLILTYMLGIADWLSTWPGASVSASISMIELLALYAVLIFGAIVLYRKVPKVRHYNFFK